MAAKKSSRKQVRKVPARERQQEEVRFPRHASFDRATSRTPRSRAPTGATKVWLQEVSLEFLEPMPSRTVRTTCGRSGTTPRRPPHEQSARDARIDSLRRGRRHQVRVREGAEGGRHRDVPAGRNPWGMAGSRSSKRPAASRLDSGVRSKRPDGRVPEEDSREKTENVEPGHLGRFFEGAKSGTSTGITRFGATSSRSTHRTIEGDRCVAIWSGHVRGDGGYWTTQKGEIADFMNAVRRSSSRGLSRRRLEQHETREGHAVEEVEKLKRQPGKISMSSARESLFEPSWRTGCLTNSPWWLLRGPGPRKSVVQTEFESLKMKLLAANR